MRSVFHGLYFFFAIIAGLLLVDQDIYLLRFYGLSYTDGQFYNLLFYWALMIAVHYIIKIMVFDRFDPEHHAKLTSREKGPK